MVQWFTRGSRTSAALLLLVSIGSLGASAAQTKELQPVDEGRRDASFRAFRRELIDALHKDDRKYILSIVDPKIMPSFESTAGGVPDFKKVWRLDEAPAEGWKDLRETLLTLLALGGSFEGSDQFWAPYVHSEWPDDVDAMEHLAVIGKRVAIRSKPEVAGPVLGRLSHDIVKVSQPGWSGKEAWVRVTAPDGTRGYVSGRYLRSPIDYRACFKKRKGKWRMTVLVAGG